MGPKAITGHLDVNFLDDIELLYLPPALAHQHGALIVVDAVTLLLDIISTNRIHQPLLSLPLA